eukprot:XP_008770375.1 PREDICTED: sorting nexin-24 isoform X3 [Rattus norvegicus]
MQTPARKPRLPGPADPRRPAGPTPRPRGAPRHPRPPTPRRRPRSGPRTSRRARAPRREREAGRPTRCGGAVSGASPLRPWRSTSRPFATRTAIWSAATRSTGARDAWKGEPGLGKCLQQSTNRQVSGALEPSSPGAVQSLAVCSWIQEEESHGEQVFKIEVLMNGRKHFVEKRYSEFHALHKKLKKCIKTPEIPSKHVRNWVPKVLEQRRQGLETYLQAVILENEELPKLFLDFLNIF